MSLEDLERRIGILEDIEDIKRLKRRYCAYCDDNYDADALADLFVEDAVWDGGIRGKSVGKEEIRSFFQKAPDPGMLAAVPRTPEEVEQELAANMPLGRRMEPEELVGAAIYLASPSAAATTGHLLVVDGGYTAR